MGCETSLAKSSALVRLALAISLVVAGHILMAVTLRDAPRSIFRGKLSAPNRGTVGAAAATAWPVNV